MAEGRRLIRWSDLLILLVAAGFWPAGVAARHPVSIVYPGRLFAIVGAVWLVAVAIAWCAVRLGARRSTAVYSTFVGVVLIMIGGRLSHEIGAWIGVAVIAAVVALIAVVLARIEKHGLADALFVGLSVALMAAPAISLFESVSGWGDSVFEPPASIDVSLNRRPDILLLVVDGYPGLRALDMDLDVDKAEFIAELGRRGFEVPESAWSPYWTTHLAVPSLLNMGYPAVRPFEGHATERDLYRVAAGDNELVRLLVSEGYETHMIESGWSGTACDDDHLDSCYSTRFLDEVTFFTLWDTVAGPFLYRQVGHSFTVGTRNTMSLLESEIGGISDDDKPSFVFAHLVAPHPPLFLDADCETVVQFERAGVSFNYGGVPVAERDSYFIDQMECVDDFILRLVDRLADDHVVVVVADHGTDRRSQQSEEVVWDNEAMIERLNVFAAFRVGAVGCSIGDPVMLPNIFRRLFACLSETDIPDVGSRAFANPMIELDPGVVKSLLGGSVDESAGG